ncbi:cytochrome b5-like [Cornus florida]|uniref:cytochrome b5-like n=1 Tax=Cornus florida TaxID=4283 RepID=UPI00289C7E07|nr:cytochrome b5-like [Cornus florida]
MNKQRVFTLSQVAQHKSTKDCWLIINGRVLDVTKFLEEHPGGDDVLLEVAGKDATKEFKNIGHSQAAQNLLLKYQVGYLQGHNIQEADSDSKNSIASYKESKGKEMSAFVIKDDAVPKYVTFAEYFVPLLVATSFFGYRYLIGAAQFSS